jgi:hypothetical protein
VEVIAMRRKYPLLYWLGMFWLYRTFVRGGRWGRR